MKHSGAWFLEQTWSRGLGVDVKQPTRKPRGRGHAYPLGAPSPSWASHGSTDLLLPAIYVHIPQKHPGAPRNPISTAATFCTQEIPSWGLFRSSAGGGIDHGGPLHQLHGPSDEVWVVYLRPTGPYLVARWLLLSFWISIQSSPRSSWRLFDVTLFAVCLSRSDELWVYDQVYLWTIFDSSLKSFMHDWLSLQVSSNYQFSSSY